MIHEISTVKNPAVPLARTIVTKSIDNENDEISLDYTPSVIHKALEKGQIFQYGLVPDIPDLQKDTINKSEIEKTTEYVKEKIFKGELRIGKEHSDFNNQRVKYIWVEYDGTGLIAKAYGFPKDKTVKGGMIVGIQLTEKGIEDYKNGEFTGISIGGNANRERVLNKNNNKISDLFKSFLKDLKDVLLHKEANKSMENNTDSKNEMIELANIMKTTIQEGFKEVITNLKEVQKLNPNEKDETETEKENLNKNNDINLSKISELENKLNEIAKKSNENKNDETLINELNSLKEEMKKINSDLKDTTELTKKLAELKGVTKTNNQDSVPDSNNFGNMWDIK